MDNERKISKSTDNDYNPSESRIGRRSLVKGLSATPLIFTVASRPVWANQCSPSGTESGNASKEAQTEVSCTTTIFNPKGLRETYASDIWLVGGVLDFFPNKLRPTDELAKFGKTEFSWHADKTIIDCLSLKNKIDGIRNLENIELKRKVAIMVNCCIWENLADMFNRGDTSLPCYQAVTGTNFYFPHMSTTLNFNEHLGNWRSYTKLS